MDWHVQGDSVYSGPWLVAQLRTDIPATVRDAVEQEIATWDGKDGGSNLAERLAEDLEEERHYIGELQKDLTDARSEIDRLSAELAALKNPPPPADEDDQE